LEIRHLETFVYVLRVGSITRAASDLHYSQSSVTAHIQALERDIDARLLDRATTGVTATPAGERLKFYAQIILALCDEVLSAVPSAEPPMCINLGSLPIGIADDANVDRLLRRDLNSVEDEAVGKSTDAGSEEKEGGR
jgi:DNA-binding transcriptional LysR family regulator